MQCLSEVEHAYIAYTSVCVRLVSNSHVFFCAGLSDPETLGSVPVRGCPCPPTKTTWSGQSGMWRWSPPG